MRTSYTPHPKSSSLAGKIGNALGPWSRGECALADECRRLEDYEKAIEAGALYSNSDLQKRQTSIVLEPPRDIFIAALIFPILHPPSQVYRKAFKPTQLFRVTSALIAAVAQLVAIWYVFVIASEMAGRHDETSQPRCDAGTSSNPLRIACLGTFVAMLFFEMRATARLIYWIQLLPRWDPKHTAVLEALKAGFATRCSLVTSEEGIQYRVNEVAAGGITAGFRAFMVLVCIFKMCMELGALIGGSAYVLYASSNEDLLLNSVALTFLLKIDDALYDCFLSDSAKRYLEHAAPKFTLLRGVKHHVDDETDEPSMTRAGRGAVLHTSASGLNYFPTEWAGFALYSATIGILYYGWCHIRLLSEGTIW